MGHYFIRYRLCKASLPQPVKEALVIVQVAVHCSNGVRRQFLGPDVLDDIEGHILDRLLNVLFSNKGFSCRSGHKSLLWVQI